MKLLMAVLLGVGLFLVLYAAALVLGPARRSAGRRAALAGSFTIMAGFVWSFVLAAYLDDKPAGLRLGFAGAAVLPAVAAMFRPFRGGIVPPAVLLALAIAAATPAIPELAARLRPGQSAAASDLEEAIDRLMARLGAAQQYRAELDNQHAATAAAIRNRAYADFQAIADDEQGLALLRKLAGIERLQAETRAGQDELRRTLARMETALRRIKRLTMSESLTDETMHRAEVVRLMEAIAEPAEPAATVAGDDPAQRENLRRLFDRCCASP